MERKCGTRGKRNIWFRSTRHDRRWDHYERRVRGKDGKIVRGSQEEVMGGGEPRARHNARYPSLTPCILYASISVHYYYSWCKNKGPFQNSRVVTTGAPVYAHKMHACTHTHIVNPLQRKKDAKTTRNTKTRELKEPSVTAEVLAGKRTTIRHSCHLLLYKPWVQTQQLNMNKKRIYSWRSPPKKCNKKKVYACVERGVCTICR